MRGVVSDIPRISKDDLAVTPAATGEATTYMVVGNDTREGLADEGIQEDAGVGRPQTAGQRADTIILLHVDPSRNKAYVLSLPRDLRVEIAGHGPDKVNAALAYDGGEQLLVDTVATYTGLKINHFIEINFQSFADIVDALGGIEYDFPYPVRDSQLAYKLPAGPQVLSGRQALMYVRSRHFQEQIDGRWKSDGKGDFGRIERQQEFMLKVLAKANGAGSVKKLNELARIAKDHVKVDANFDFDTAMSLYRQMTPVTPENIEFVKLPAKPTNRNGVAYIEALPEADGVLAYLRGQVAGEQPPAPAPEVSEAAQRGETRVRVLNGTAEKGLAANAQLRLRKLGFGTGPVGDSPTPQAKSRILYGPGALAKGMLVADALQLDDVEPGTVGDTDVMVILGNGFRLPELASTE